MQNKNIHILSTRPIDASLIKEAAAKGIQVDTVSFIDTVAIDTTEVKKAIEAVAAQPSIIIFTSMNAVDAVVHQLNNNVPDWKIFCMGNTTRQLVENYFGKEKIIATGSNATELAEEIINWKNSQQDKMPVVFFCGDQRRDELPGRLLEQHIVIKEIITYNTIETTHLITDAYNGILFFSPSAVHSFFKTNKAANKTVFFSIGETTANTIKDYTGNKIITSNTPAKDELLRQAVEWFNAVES